MYLSAERIAVANKAVQDTFEQSSVAWQAIPHWDTGDPAQTKFAAILRPRGPKIWCRSAMVTMSGIRVRQVDAERCGLRSAGPVRRHLVSSRMKPHCRARGEWAGRRNIRRHGM